MAYIRVERDETEPGQKHIARNDKIVAVDDDGTRVEFSSAVLEWGLTSRVGEPRTLTLVVAAFDLPGGD